MAWAPDYVTVEELKSFNGISVSTNDASLALAIAAASRAVDQFCNRQFGQVAALEERSYPGEWDRRLNAYVVTLDDVSWPVTGMSVTVAGEPVTDYTLRPLNAPAERRPYTSLLIDSVGSDDLVVVSALWGWSSVPQPVKQATLLQANRIFKRHDSPFGVYGSPQMQGEIRLLAKIDADVSVILQPYLRWWGAA